MKGFLILLVAGALAAFADVANACKILVVYPDHLTEVEPHLYFVVKIADTDGDDLVGLVKRSFGGALVKGDKVTVRFKLNEEPHAVCPIELKPGKRYLLRGTVSANTIEVSRFNWLNIPSNHERFDTYVKDLISMGSAR